MDPIIIAIIVILCQYPIAILTLLKLFRTNEEKSGMIFWNVFVIAVPFIGAISFWIYYAAVGKHKPPRKTVAPTETESSGAQNAESTGMAAPETATEAPSEDTEEIPIEE